MFNLSLDFERLDQKTHVTYRWEPLIVNHHLAKFGGHRQCGSRDIMLLVADKQDSTASLKSTITAYL